MSLYHEEDIDIVTWAEFVIIFDHQYIPESVRHMNKLEFINFSQKNMTILEYKARFVKVGNFFMALDMDDARKS